MAVESFDAWCPMVQVPNPEWPQGYEWQSYIAANYKCRQVSQATQSDPDTGAPNPNWCLVQGEAETSVIEAMRSDGNITLLE